MNRLQFLFLILFVSLTAHASPVDLKLKTDPSIEQRLLELEKRQIEFENWVYHYFMQKQCTSGASLH